MDTELETPDVDGRNDGGPDVIVRTFAAEVAAADGHTIDVRIVPYGESAIAADGFGGVPKGVPYREQWMPGAFTQITRAKKVLVNFEHQQGLSGVIGHGIALRDASDGLYGSFEIHETPDGEKALMLVRKGVLGGVSLEVPVRSVKSVRTATGIVQRVSGYLKGIALCREGAYESSVVLAVREATVFDEEMLPVEIDPELVARCERLGIALPERMKAHPAETGTPAEADTP